MTFEAFEALFESKLEEDITRRTVPCANDFDGTGEKIVTKTPI